MLLASRGYSQSRIGIRVSIAFFTAVCLSVWLSSLPPSYTYLLTYIPEILKLIFTLVWLLCAQAYKWVWRGSNAVPLLLHMRISAGLGSQGRQPA